MGNIFYCGQVFRETKYDGHFISADGVLLSLRKGPPRVRKTFLNKDGYERVNITERGKRREVERTLMPQISRIVAETWIGPPANKKITVNHKNGIVSDNRASNLEWMTQGDNTRHAFRVLGSKSHVGGDNPRAKLRADDVRAIRSRLALGEPCLDIAREYGVVTATIVAIRTRRNWAHIE